MGTMDDHGWRLTSALHPNMIFIELRVVFTDDLERRHDYLGDIFRGWLSIGRPMV